MKMHEINDELSKLSIEDKDKNVFLKIIETKIDTDMEKILAKIDSRFDSVNSKFDGVNSKFDSVNSKFDSVNSKFDSINSSVNSSFNSVNAKIDWLKWLIGSIGVAVLIAALKYAFFS